MSSGPAPEVCTRKNPRRLQTVSAGAAGPTAYLTYPTYPTYLTYLTYSTYLTYPARPANRGCRLARRRPAPALARSPRECAS